ncbi:MAG: cation-transporting P-type ATPase [Bifidobacteriaceae bacterium]|jgi:Ca2+-transporting ATPase|nr:cation-transporting P-type ATPase [Bifidobacteriaceae bacterium]
MKEYLAESKEVLLKFGTNPDAGLSNSKVNEAQTKYGKNSLPSPSKQTLVSRILKTLKDPMIILLLVVALITLLSAAAEGFVEPPYDFFVIIAVLILNTTLSIIQENNADNALEALKNMTVATQTVIRNDKQEIIDGADLVPGDIIILNEGDMILADARIIHCDELHTIEMGLTGESVPVTKTADIIKTDAAEVALGDRHNMVYSGTFVASGSAQAVVTATGLYTETGKIARALQIATVENDAELTPLQKEMNDLGVMLTKLVIVLSVLIGAILIFTRSPGSLNEWVSILVLTAAIALAALPESLVALIAIVFSMGVTKMAKEGAIVKNLNAIETCGAVTVVMSDKTVTLSEGKDAVQKVVAYDGNLIGDDNKQFDMLFTTGITATNASWQSAKDGIGDPTELAMVNYLDKTKYDQLHISPKETDKIIPFSSNRKMMSKVIFNNGKSDYTVYTKGAPDYVLQKCTKIIIDGQEKDLTKALRDTTLKTIENLADDALRTLGFAYKKVKNSENQTDDYETDLVFIGIVGLMDPPRQSVKPAIKEIHNAGIRTVVISGDHSKIVTAISKELGILSTDDLLNLVIALDGVQIDKMSKSELKEAVKTVNIYGRVSPENKDQIGRAIRSNSNITLASGDGVNDAVFLKSSDIGIAVADATEVTKSAADIVLTDNNYGTIVKAIKNGREIYDNLVKIIRFLFCTNFGEVFIVLFACLFADMIYNDASVMPLTAIAILWINIVSDSLPAMALGIDPSVEDVMARPPRSINDKIMNKSMWFDCVFYGLLFAMGVLGVGAFAADHTNLLHIQTISFAAISFAEMTFVFISRSAKTTMFHSLFSNYWLWGAVLLTAGLQVIITEVWFLQPVFGTVHLTLNEWGITLIPSLILVVVSEIRKLSFP